MFGDQRADLGWALLVGLAQQGAASNVDHSLALRVEHVGRAMATCRAARGPSTVVSPGPFLGGWIAARRGKALHLPVVFTADLRAASANTATAVERGSPKLAAPSDALRAPRTARLPLDTALDEVTNVVTLGMAADTHRGGGTACQPSGTADFVRIAVSGVITEVGLVRVTVETNGVTVYPPVALQPRVEGDVTRVAHSVDRSHFCGRLPLWLGTAATHNESCPECKGAACA